jgi:hypothetical protein
MTGRRIEDEQDDDRLADVNRVSEVRNVTSERFANEIVPAYRPVILRGMVGEWPAVKASRQGPRATAEYIRRFDGGRPAKVFAASPHIGGRFFYTDDHQGFNFKTAQVMLPLLLDALVAEAGNPDAPSLYAGSASAPDNYPGWAEANPFPFALPGATPRLWIGNASRASTHYDGSNNIAAVVAGSRRFALFPPEQTRNLYVGPLENTIAGQPTSMVDLENPDLARYPRFAQAMDSMLVAELEPGDALFIPAFWWHDVKASGPLNVLVNYWWGQAEMSPFGALMHAVLAVRDLPSGERAAVRTWFDHYVFEDSASDVASHLPAQARGVLGPPSPERTRSIRGFLKRILGDA